MALIAPKLMHVVALVLMFLIGFVRAIFDGEMEYNMFTSHPHLDHTNRIPKPEWTDCSVALEIFENRGFTILTTVELVVLDYCVELRYRIMKPKPRILSIFENTKRLDRQNNKTVKKCMAMLKEFVHEEHVNVAVRHLEPCESDLLNEYANLIKCTRLIRAGDKASRDGGNYFEVIMSYVSKTMSMCFVQFDRVLEKDFRQIENVHGNILDKVANKFITKVHLLAPMKFLINVLTGQEEDSMALQLIDKVNFRTQEDQDKLLSRIMRFTEQMYHHNLAKDYDNRPLLQDDLSIEMNEVNLKKAYQYSVRRLCSPMGLFGFDDIFETYISFLSSNKDVMEELRLDLNKFTKTINEGAHLKPIYYSTKACIFLSQNTIGMRRADTGFEFYFKSVIHKAIEEGLEPINLARWP